MNAQATAVLAGLPENARKLFVMYADDAGNWSGQPLVGGNVHLLGQREDRGLLTHLKRAGLVSTQVDGREAWLQFTALGRSAALQVSESFRIEFPEGA